VKLRSKWIAVAATAVGVAGAALLAVEARSSSAALPSQAFTYQAVLNQAQEVPKPKPARLASGDFSAKMTILNGNQVTLGWRLKVVHLSGPALAAHVHLAARGKPGPIIIPLCAPCKLTAAGIVTGTFKKKMPTAQIKALESGGTYVNVHTKLNPAGEIRGQLPTPRAAAPSPAGGNATGQPTTGVVVPTTPALVAQGKALSTKYSCEGCHTLNGQNSTGPTWKGLAGSTVTLDDGTTVKATDAYLIEAITQPDVQIVQGYSSGIMSTAIGSIPDAQARAIVAYIKTIH